MLLIQVRCLSQINFHSHSLLFCLAILFFLFLTLCLHALFLCLLATSSLKAIGVQTDRSDDFSKNDLNNGLASHFDRSNKLLGIWGSMSEQQLGRNLISKLFMACPTDFQILFGCMSMNMLPNQISSHAALQNDMRSFPLSEAAKVCHFYSVLTKVWSCIETSFIYILGSDY